eukprot:1027098_1
MALQQENARKCFENIHFSKVEDKFSVLVQYDANTESLTMTFTNQTTKNVFRQRFGKEDIQQITTRYHLEPSLLVKMITDTFASSEQVLKHARIFITANNEQAIAKRNDIQTMRIAPDAIHIPTGFTPDPIVRTNAEETKTEKDSKLCLLFVLHFSSPPYIYLNYCFTLKQKHVSDSDVLNMRFNDLQKENKTLQQSIQTQEQQINQLVQTVRNQNRQINALTKRVHRNDTRLKVEEIDLHLMNKWKCKPNNQYNAYAPPKATKIGKIVHLKGSIIYQGSTGIYNNNTLDRELVATVPQGWRPSKDRRFFLDMNKSWTIFSDGRVKMPSGYCDSLDGISFVLD